MDDNTFDIVEFMETLNKVQKIPELTVEEFLLKYKPLWINYCEIIILQNGNIFVAQPSHTERLIAITGIDRDELYDMIQITDSPIHWLINFTKNVSVWYDFQLLPKRVSEAQLITLNILAKENMIVANYSFVESI